MLIDLKKSSLFVRCSIYIKPYDHLRYLRLLVSPPPLMLLVQADIAFQLGYFLRCSISSCCLIAVFICRCMDSILVDSH